MDLDDILSVAECAEISGKSRETIRKAFQRGSLRGKRVGETDYRSQWITTRALFEEWLAGVRLYEQRRDGAGRFRGPVTA